MDQPELSDGPHRPKLFESWPEQNPTVEVICRAVDRGFMVGTGCGLALLILLAIMNPFGPGGVVLVGFELAPLGAISGGAFCGARLLLGWKPGTNAQLPQRRNSAS